MPISLHKVLFHRFQHDGNKLYMTGTRHVWRYSFSLCFWTLNIFQYSKNTMFQKLDVFPPKMKGGSHLFCWIL